MKLLPGSQQKMMDIPRWFPVAGVMLTFVVLGVLSPVATAETTRLADRVTALESRGAPQVGVNPGGGGFYIQDEDFRLRVLGYTQAQANIFDGAQNREGVRDFSVRRARINFLVDLYEDFEFFLELDGAPSSRTAMVEARLNWKILDDALQLRAGKFTSQFSTENARSSRAIDTIERYLALNSMFLLPALDTQFGVMLHGHLGAQRAWGYSLGLYNGNSSANANVRDNNDEKEIQAKLTYRWAPNLQGSLALSHTRESAQTLRLVDVGFNTYTAVAVDGNRNGVGADFLWHNGSWRLSGEGLFFRFDGRDQERAELTGGFIQPSWFSHGDEQGGTQWLLRAEFTQINASTGDNVDRLVALTAGVNWFLNPNVRLQVNAIATQTHGGTTEQGFTGSRTLPSLLTQLQFKF